MEYIDSVATATGVLNTIPSLREIAEATGVGVATVQRLMAALVSADVVTRAGRYGAWRLNPEVVFAGSGKKRMNVLIRYRTEKQIDLFEDVQEPERKAA